MSWAQRRKAIYTSGAGGFILLLGVLVFFLFIYQPHSCSDGRQNGNELGIDCGGDCVKICSEEAAVPVILWSRSFEVVPGIYNAVAYVENTNTDAAVRRITYRFKLFEQGNILITERIGQTYLLPHRLSVVVEPSVNVGQRIPVRTQFEFLEIPAWEQVADTLVPKLTIRNQKLEQGTAAPRVSALVVNGSDRDLEQVEATAVLFDAKDNAIAASRTSISTLGRSESKEIIFTWPQSFLETVSRVDVQVRAPITH